MKMWSVFRGAAFQAANPLSTGSGRLKDGLRARLPAPLEKDPNRPGAAEEAVVELAVAVSCRCHPAVECL